MSVRIDLEKFSAKVKKKLKVSVSRANMAKLGAEALRIIRRRIRKGFGVKRQGTTEKKFPPLSSGYIKQRKNSRLSPFTSPSKSNVTNSGRLIAGLRYKAKQGKFQISPTGKSRGGVPNEDVAEYLADQGRVFLNLSRGEQQKLISFYRRKLIKSNK